MKNDTLKEYALLRAALEKERDQLKARLASVEAALAGQLKPEAPVAKAAPKRRGRGRPPVAQAAAKVRDKVRKRRKMSPEARARIAEGARKRWARIRAQSGQAQTQPTAETAQPAAQTPPPA